MNKVILIGRLTKDVEVRNAGEMKIARYSLAIDRKKKDLEQTADFVNCVAFGRGGEFAEKYLHKGMKIGVIGRIQSGSYLDKDGKRVYTTDIVVEDHEFVESKNANEQTTSVKTDENGFVSVPDGVDEELPFF